VTARPDTIKDTSSKIIRADGTTPAERYLKRLCDKSFLSMWSYAGVYRDQGHTKQGGHGKEVCDLLVVFKNHIIIFSDKDCEFPKTGNVELDWSRWYRKAILKSAEQVWGAERWILTHPDRLFTDRSCAVPFPIDVPGPDVAKIHRIVVAHAASERCIKDLGGSGSLMIMPDIIGDAHCAAPQNSVIPFAIGQINPSKGFVHVFDDTTLDVVMTTLDTVTDFVNYLTKKERFITSGKLAAACGEDDLLAYYQKKIDTDGEHNFIVPPNIDFIMIEEGLWQVFSNRTERKARLLADEVSYSWDALIETFSHHIYDGTSHYISHPGINNQEKVFRLMAGEPRLRRRLLAKSLLDFIFKSSKTTRATRTMVPSKPGEPYYVFLVLPHIESVPEEEYREVRRNLLSDYCIVTKLSFPDATDIIGIATESGRKSYGSEDAMYYDARAWTPEEQGHARQLQTEMTELGLLGDRQMFTGNEKEYPDAPTYEFPKQSDQASTLMKGRNRNDLCRCGSGKKLKKCCGQ
jgi:SEC-C motif-containing protein